MKEKIKREKKAIATVRTRIFNKNKKLYLKV